MRRLRHPTLDEVQLVQVLSALGDPIRLAIVRLLVDGEEHVRSEFDAPVAQSTLSHHVKTLRDAGIVQARQDATRCLLSLRPELGERFPGLLDAVLACDQTTGDAKTARR